MAIARCKVCGKPKHNKPPAYSDSAYMPPNYPNSGLICGTKGCENPALIWLKTDEEQEYQQGARIFDLRTNSAKACVVSVWISK